MERYWGKNRGGEGALKTTEALSNLYQEGCIRKVVKLGDWGEEPR